MWFHRTQRGYETHVPHRSQPNLSIRFAIEASPSRREVWRDFSRRSTRNFGPAYVSLALPSNRVVTPYVAPVAITSGTIRLNRPFATHTGAGLPEHGQTTSQNAQIENVIRQAFGRLYKNVSTNQNVAGPSRYAFEVTSSAPTHGHSCDRHTHRDHSTPGGNSTGTRSQQPRVRQPFHQLDRLLQTGNRRPLVPAKETAGNRIRPGRRTKAIDLENRSRPFCPHKSVDRRQGGPRERSLKSITSTPPILGKSRLPRITDADQ